MGPALRRYPKTNLGIMCSHRINHKNGSESAIPIFRVAFVDGTKSSLWFPWIKSRHRDQCFVIVRHRDRHIDTVVEVNLLQEISKGIFNATGAILIYLPDLQSPVLQHRNDMPPIVSQLGAERRAVTTADVHFVGKDISLLSPLAFQASGKLSVALWWLGRHAGNWIDVNSQRT